VHGVLWCIGVTLILARLCVILALLWLYVLDITTGNQGAILGQGSRNIQRPGGHAEPVEAGVLC
jgi:hypothetical protein